MKSWFEIKVRGMLGPDRKDDEEGVILGRTVKWVGRDRIEYAADRKHRDKILEHFGMDKGTRALTSNGEKEQKETEGNEIDSGNEESTLFSLAANPLNK